MSLLKDKVCLVTGCTKGIGRAIVERFAKEEAIIYANGRSQDELKKLAEDMKAAYGAKVNPLCFDVTESELAKQAVMKIKKDQGKIDVLVNNAGIMSDAVIGMVSKPMMEEIFAVNVFAGMELLQLVARIMRKQHSGSIINMASIVGVYGNKGQLVYSASKGAVIAMTKTAAKELAADNIRVNAIAPGMIDTDMFRSIGEEHIKERIELIGMNRIGKPSDVADACTYLASDLSSYVTGQIIGVDGSAIV